MLVLPPVCLLHIYPSFLFVCVIARKVLACRESSNCLPASSLYFWVRGAPVRLSVCFTLAYTFPHRLVFTTMAFLLKGREGKRPGGKGFPNASLLLLLPHLSQDKRIEEGRKEEREGGREGGREGQWRSDIKCLREVLHRVQVITNFLVRHVSRGVGRGREGGSIRVAAAAVGVPDGPGGRAPVELLLLLLLLVVGLLLLPLLLPVLLLLLLLALLVVVRLLLRLLRLLI